MTTKDKPTILAVDDNHDALYALEKILIHNDYAVITAVSGEDALQKAREHVPDMVLLDVMLPAASGYEVTRELKSDNELRYTPIILLSAKDSLADIVRGLDEGADDYITKPFTPEELLARLRAGLRLKKLYDELRFSEDRNAQLVGELNKNYDFTNIVGESAALKNMFALLEKVAVDDSPVLVTGPTGSGKELVARAVHFHSPRKDAAFVAQNCAVLNENLIESQLFGHVKGAFTGATKDRKGLFQVADGGTLFLDEIGEMAADLQAKLLRVLQEGTLMPVGSTTEQRVDVRIVAATNRDLGEMVSQGTFREDLYYRLNVITLELPALNERKDDIPLLTEHFLKRAAAKRNAEVKQLSEEVLAVLKQYRWPGNVRELENEIERLLILGRDEEIIGADLISSRILREIDSSVPVAESKGGLREAVENVEREMIVQTLQRLDWNKSTAAKELGISRSSLISKVKQFGLEKQ